MPSRSRLALWLVLAGAYALVTQRFHRMFVFADAGQATYGVSDDVYITASFGRSLFTGHGAVWYAGAPKVEGYTSPLWTAIVGAFHIVPGFDESAIGLWIVGANVALLFALLWTLLRQLDRARVASGHHAARLWLVLPVMLGGGALCYWAAEGFEVVLVALLALLGFGIAASKPLTPRNALIFGALFGLGFWARMDSVVYWSGAWLLLAVRARRDRQARPMVLAASAGAGMVLLQLVARYSYYGDLLPNTYYLKATNWPLADRLAMGMKYDASLFPSAILIWLPLALPQVRRALGSQLASVLASFLVYSLSVLYSVHNGGDAWRLQAGHDRYTVIGAVFLLLGFGTALVSVRAARAFHALALIACTACALDPVTRQDNWRQVHADRLFADAPPLRTREREWIEYGTRFEQISKPGARIALCPAGAIVYYSHRGAVDLLGKVDPFVARLPATPKRPPSGFCWQDAPGHNKENDAATFALRNPDFTRYRPPRGFKQRYHELRYKGLLYYVRDDTPYLRDDVVGRDGS